MCHEWNMCLRCTCPACCTLCACPCLWVSLGNLINFINCLSSFSSAKWLSLMYFSVANSAQLPFPLKSCVETLKGKFISVQQTFLPLLFACKLPIVSSLRLNNKPLCHCCLLSNLHFSRASRLVLFTGAHPRVYCCRKSEGVISGEDHLPVGPPWDGEDEHRPQHCECAQ
jgi:hypothetical protein